MGWSLGLEDIMKMRSPWWRQCPYQKKKRDHSFPVRERALTKRLCQHRGLGTDSLASREVRNGLWWLKPPGRWSVALRHNRETRRILLGAGAPKLDHSTCEPSVLSHMRALGTPYI